MSQTTAGLIIIGNEILSGRTQDTNTQWLADKMTHLGIRLIEVRVIPDLESAIRDTVLAMKDKVTYLFTTGGIGPTHDDITSASIASAFKTELIVHPEARQLLASHYGGEDKLTEPRLKMAMVPKGAELIQNPVSAAPGFKIGNVYVMAGVPRIMQAMLDGIIAGLERGKPILSNTVTCGLGESSIARDLEKIQNQYPEVEIGSYPHYRSGILGLSLVLRSTDNDLLHKATGQVVAMIREHGGEPRAISVKSSGPGFETQSSFV
jgi:molybdenum cofactor synthesis domain-containing protein